MSAALPIPVIQLLQVLTVAIGAPAVTGVIAKVEARLQGRRGPRVIQPYYDLAKLARKEALAPRTASWFFLAAPLIAVAAYLTIPLLIPVLTTYGLPLGYMGDILGGGFLLSLASFVVATDRGGDAADRVRHAAPGAGPRSGAAVHGAIGKAAGYADDARLGRPYDAFPSLAVPPVPTPAGRPDLIPTPMNGMVPRARWPSLSRLTD